MLKNLALQDQPIMERKIREIALASHLEDLLGKHKILEIYLNEIFLGQNSYGVTAAAQTYFNKSLEQLTSYEAATLAAFAQNPSRLHPVRNRQRLTTRRNYVLQEMFENGYLPEDQLTISLKHSVETVQSGASPSYLASLPDRTYVTDGIRRELSRDLGPEVFQTAGLTIEPSIDERLQGAAENALRRTLERFDRNKRIWRPTGLEIDQVLLEDEPRWREALARAPIARDIHLTTQWRPAVVLSLRRDNARIGIEGVAEDQDGHWLPFSRTRWRWRQNDDGTRGRRARRMSDLLKVGEVVQVRAVLDARGRFVRWSLRQIPELQGAFMAMDPMTGRILALQGGFSYQHSPFNRASQAMRQPGSTFKPFVYAAALTDGVSPYSRVLDARVAIETEDGMWRPENADHIELGSMPIRVGIEQSRNLMTVRLAQSVGLEPIGQLSEDLGLYDEMAPLWSNVLGAQETTLERLIAAYAAFANGGHLVQPTLVSRALDRNGAPLSGIGSDQSRIDTRDPELSPLVAYQISRMLRGVVLHGTARNHVFLDVPTAGKTGTTNDSKDAWFIGFTSNLVAGCYIGYDTPRTIEHNATGASVCGPVFQSFMREAVQIYGGSQFALLD